MANINKAAQIVADRITDQLKNGIIPWHKPWAVPAEFSSNCPALFPVSYQSGKPYSFKNAFLLSKPGFYATFNQIKEAGGRVKKGAKSSCITFYSMVEKKTQAAEDGSDAEPEYYPCLKYYNVFNLNDCEGIDPSKKFPNAVMEIEEEHPEQIQELEQVITSDIE